MPGFSSRDDLITEVTTNGKQDVWNFYKAAASVSQGQFAWHTMWKGTGRPGAGSDPATTPGTVYITDASTAVAGAIWFPDRSTDQRYLLSMGAISSTPNCTLMLYDRLAGVSGISVATTGSKTINSGALDRYSGTAATLNEAWFEVTTGTTTTAPIVNLDSYTSADGTTGQVGGSVTFPATATVAGALIQLPLDASKQGIRSIEAGLNVGTAGATGIGNVIIIRVLARIPMMLNTWNEINFLDDTMRLPQIYDNATLGLAYMTTSGAQATMSGAITCAYG